MITSVDQIDVCSGNGHTMRPETETFHIGKNQVPCKLKRMRCTHCTYTRATEEQVAENQKRMRESLRKAIPGNPPRAWHNAALD